MYHISRLMFVERNQILDISLTFKHHALSFSKNTCLMFYFRVLNMIKLFDFFLQVQYICIQIVHNISMCFNKCKQKISADFCYVLYYWMTHKTHVYLNVSLEINYRGYKKK